MLRHHLWLLSLPFVGLLWVPFYNFHDPVLFGFCLFTRWFVAPALLAGWAVSLIGGTYLSWADGLKPLHLVTFGKVSFTAYVGLIALIANIVTAVVVNAILIQTRKPSHAFGSAP